METCQMFQHAPLPHGSHVLWVSFIFISQLPKFWAELTMTSAHIHYIRNLLG